DKAMAYYQKVYNTPTGHRMYLQQTFPLKAMANLYWDQGDRESSIRLAHELVSSTRRLNIKLELARALSLLGQRLIAVASPDEALQNLGEAAGLFPEAGETEDALKPLTSIASVNANPAKGLASSLDAVERIRAIYKQLNSPAGEIQGLIEIARQSR